MSLLNKLLFFLVLILFVSCKTNSIYIANNSTKEILNINEQKNDAVFVNLKNYSKNFVYEMKYATDDNFLKKKVYPCAECFLRVKTVKWLLEANKVFLDKGYRIKLYDCYRPLAIQKKMWKIVPDANYVANPKRGSIHNKGGAVDITLVDLNGKELEMGTTFDFFGKESSHNYLNLSEEILANRKFLKEIMLQNNFKSFDSEWWHYNLNNSSEDKVSNLKWRCN
jgi:D-alanyl-D-alanine dipeptidase